MYLVSYLTRINYGAVVAEMVRETGLSKPALSAALTGSFITYGTGQLLSGWLGDRIQPRTLIALGLTTTVTMNLLLPFCPGVGWMTAVWCVNGLAQAFMWPPLVKLMATLFSSDQYRRSCTAAGIGGSLGTVLIYLVAPVCIALAGWRSVFWVCGGCGLIMLLLWLRTCPVIPMKAPVLTRAEGDAPAKMPLHRILLSPMMLGIVVCIVLQGALRDGVTTWMPNYITEVYDLTTVVSILTGVILPLFGIASIEIASLLYKRTPQNPLKCATLLLAVGAGSALPLALLFSRNAALSVALSALLTGCMHGVNLMLISMTPPFFQKWGRVSTMSGVLNAFTYIGSAGSTYGIALLSERLGWQPTILLWFAIAGAGAVICGLCIPAWQRFLRQ